MDRSTPHALSEAPRLYFGYTPLLDGEVLRAWQQVECPQLTLPAGEVAEALEVDLVFERPSKRWGGRIAGLVKRPGRSVFGRLYTVPSSQWPLLRQAEAAWTASCGELLVKVRVGHRVMEATAFTTSPGSASLEGPVSERYAQALAKAAESAGLPGPWVSRLKAEAMILERVQAFGARMNLS